MLTYRTFRNTDPPVLAALWRSCAGQPGLWQPVSSDLLDQLIFSKPYFDSNGLFLAWDDDRPVGFAHAGFGSNAEQSETSTDAGVTCIVLVRPDCSTAGEVANGLLERCEEYLRDHGAKILYGGGLNPLNPFYVGLYGGSELPGVLESDTIAKQAFVAHGYQEADRTVILRRDLCGFEALVDRQQMQVRRQMIVEVINDAPSRTWWEACTLGEFDLTRFDLVPRSGGSAVATATFRNMEPIGSNRVSGAVGLSRLFVDEAYRRRGLALFLLGEAFRQFVRQRIMHVEAHAMQNNAIALDMFRKLGFQQMEQGVVWKKDA